MSRLKQRARKVGTNRRKVSTTVSPETQAYLDEMISRGSAASLAEALDRLVAEARRWEQRIKLERDTAAYFDSLPEPIRAEEARLGRALASAASELDFER